MCDHPSLWLLLSVLFVVFVVWFSQQQGRHRDEPVAGHKLGEDQLDGRPPWAQALVHALIDAALRLMHRLSMCELANSTSSGGVCSLSCAWC